MSKDVITDFSSSSSSLSACLKFSIICKNMSVSWVVRSDSLCFFVMAIGLLVGCDAFQCFRGLDSDAAVRFGPVQRTLCPNLEPDLWFSSSRLLNLGLDLEGPVQQVRFGESIGLNLEPQIFCINIAEKWCEYYLVNISRSGMS